MKKSSFVFCILNFLLCGVVVNSSETNDFLLKFAMTKAREQCVGEKLTRIWEKQVRHVVEECRYPHGNPSYNYNPGQFHYSYEHTVSTGPDPLGQIPIGFIPDQAITIGNHGFGLNGLIVPPIGHRYKRSVGGVLDSASEGKHVIKSLILGEQKILEQISNVSCILRSLGVITSDGDIQISDISRATAQMPVDDYLKNDLLDGVDQCANFIDCLPAPSQSFGLIPFEIKRAYVFVRCLQLKRQEACVKKDIRKNIKKHFPHEVGKSIDLQSFAQRMLEVLMAEDVEEYEALLL